MKWFLESYCARFEDLEPILNQRVKELEKLQNMVNEKA
jgi:hypothetical protein